MLRMCKPRKPHRGEDPNGIYWHDSPALRTRLGQYCKQDVEVERELHSRIGFISEAEQKVWEVDRVINDRGVFIDAKLLDGALSIMSAREAEIQQEIAALTGGQVTSISQVDKLGEWLKGQGCEIANLQDETLQKLLKRMDLPSLAVRQAIQLRLDGASAAASKHFKLKKQCGAGDRVRGGFIYHVGGTGRWGSWGVQLQNMKKPETKEIELAISLISGGDLQAVKQHFTDTMGAAGDISRALLCASPGHRLLIADYSGIESRVGAWIAGEQSKVDAWRRFDETKNPKDEPYYQTGKNFGRPEEEARGVGKTANLAFMYMGGIPSWRRFANDKTSTDEQIKGFRDRWRAEHPNIVRFWKNMTMSAARAVRRPNTRVPCGRVSFTCDDFFLRMRLPSGREIFYPQPHVEADEFGNPIVLFKDNAKGFTDTRAWSGHLMNNVVQGTARDIFAEALPRLEAAGYPVVMHIHDEVVCEVPDGVGTLDEFKRLMTTLPEWAEGLPIAIGKPRNGQRFAKIEAPAAAAPIPARQSDANSTPEPEIIQQNGQTPPWEPDEACSTAAGSTDETEPPPKPEPQQYLIKFTYQGAGGAPYMQVWRTQWTNKACEPEKDFKQYHFEKGRWIPGRPKGPYVPFRLPELRAAPIDALVHIMEGEKNAVQGAELGLITTTNPGGAGNWADELNEHFLGRCVCIHEDNDEAGRRHVAKVAAALTGTAKEIQIVRYPELREKGDFCDFIEGGGTIERVLARAQPI